MRESNLTVITDTTQIRQNRTSSRSVRQQQPNPSSPQAASQGEEETPAKETEEREDGEGEEEEEGGEEEEEEEEPSSACSSASVPDENIDFSLVYALHAFKATLEGQTTVDRGDPLLLLDDSNSYWWLVKLTQTEKIGYIPAENIETPYERLARLNRHRNIKLSSSQQHAELGPGKEDISRTAKDGETRKQRRVNFSENLILPSPTTVGDSYYEDEDEDMEEDDGNESDDGEVDQRSNGATKAADDKTTEQGSHQGNRKEAAEEEEKAKEKEKEKSGGGNFFGKIIHSIGMGTTNRQSASSSATPPASNLLPDVSSEEKPTKPSSADAVYPTDKRMSVSAEPYSRIRVFSGNLGGAPLFKTLAVTEETTVQQLTGAAVERFHLKEDGGSEYYLTIKVLNGEEIRLNADDRPMDVYRTLYYTASGSLDQHDPNIYGNDAPVKFFLQKRLSRVNQRQGQLIFRVLWYPPQKSSVSSAQPSRDHDYDQRSKRSNSMLVVPPKKRGTSTASTSPSSTESVLEDDSQVISKLISVGTEATANEVLTLALEKFNVTAASGEQSSLPNDDSGYLLVCIAPGQPERVLPPNQLVKELLLDQSGSSSVPARRTSLNASAMPSNAQKNSHYEEELHLVLTRRSRASVSLDATPKRSSSLLVSADRDYRKSFVEGTASLESLDESSELGQRSPVSSRGPQIPDTIDNTPLSDIALSETIVPPVRTTSSPEHSLHTPSSPPQQQVGASPLQQPDGSSKGTEHRIPEPARVEPDANEIARQELPTSETTDDSESLANNARAQPPVDAADVTVQDSVEGKRGPVRAEMVIGKGMSSSPSFTLRARPEDESPEAGSSRRNSSRPRLSLVLTPRDLSLDNDGEDVEIDVSDIINDIIYGGGGDEEEEEDVLVSQELPVGLEGSFDWSGEFSSSQSSLQSTPPPPTIVASSTTLITSPAPTRSLDDPITSSKTSTNSSNPSLGLSAIPEKDAPRPKQSAGVMSPGGEDMLDDLEAYLDSLKADLSKEKLGKLETVLNKVKQTAMKRLSAAPLATTPSPNRDGTDRDSSPSRSQNAAAMTTTTTGDKEKVPPSVRRDNDPKRGSPSSSRKISPSPQPERTIPNVSRSLDFEKGSLYNDAGLNDLLVMVRSGWTEEMISVAKPGTAPNIGSQRTTETTDDQRGNQPASLTTDQEAEKAELYRQEVRLNEMEQELDDLMSKVSSNWSINTRSQEP